MTRTEQWPELADVSRKAAGYKVLVYGEAAMLEADDPEVCDQFFNESQLRALAAAGIWAADRLAAR